MRKLRDLDKLIDELAKEKMLDKVLRGTELEQAQRAWRAPDETAPSKNSRKNI